MNFYKVLLSLILNGEIRYESQEKNSDDQRGCIWAAYFSRIVSSSLAPSPLSLFQLIMFMSVYMCGHLKNEYFLTEQLYIGRRTALLTWEILHVSFD